MMMMMMMMMEMVVISDGDEDDDGDGDDDGGNDGDDDGDGDDENIFSVFFHTFSFYKWFDCAIFLQFLPPPRGIIWSFSTFLKNI